MPTKTKAVKLTAAQKTNLSDAQRAHRDPKPSICWTEDSVISQTPPRTRRVLEELGLIENYLVDSDGCTHIRYRLTEAGLACEI